MDPLTQGLLGASAAQNLSPPRRYAVAAATLGFLSGMAADLDVLIRSPHDSLLFLEFHRQFTHSLVFIPVGALLCAAVLRLFFRRRWPMSFGRSALFCGAGYATHALLDACTTYGTQLLWPFSDTRVAWNILSIIDPLYTLPIAALVALAWRGNRRWAARLALAWILTYPLLGVVQRERAEAEGYRLAASRGHEVESLEAKPSFANLILWKTVYRSHDRFYVDAVRVARDIRIYPGDSIAALNIPRDLPWLPSVSRQANDVKRFDWFSKGYTALQPGNPSKIIDIRYSILPHELDALWSIQLFPDEPQRGVEYQAHRNSREKTALFWAMLRGEDPPSAPGHSLAASGNENAEENKAL
ncbi:metal-dependent hydrolase [Spongiibacter marinus]|uniref:metal-dependent hydrolase n=1 Tax=Spongiibacter marinus TaxID=354246 RepID=UPI003C3A16D3